LRFKASTTNIHPVNIMSRWQRILLCWAVLGFAAAEYVKRLHLSDRAQLIVGVIELTLAIATGIAFGIAAIRKNN